MLAGGVQSKPLYWELAISYNEPIGLNTPDRFGARAHLPAAEHGTDSIGVLDTNSTRPSMEANSRLTRASEERATEPQL